MQTPRPAATGADNNLRLDGSPLSLADFVSVARHGAPVLIAEGVRQGVTASRYVVEAATTDGLAHYGINTGFGSLSRTRIAADQLRDLQRNLIRSHAAGVGPPLPVEVVRGMMLLTAASLARGMSGVRAGLIEAIVALLNAGVTPVVPETGSVGASGDLAPLAHAALVLIGEGEATTRDGRGVRGAEALRVARLTPVVLEAKEGLALINGTHLMASMAGLLCADAERLFDAACAAAAMSIDACRGTDSFLDDRVHAARRQPGQAEIAARLRRLLHGTQIVPSHAEDDPRVQDPYSLRCTPQVLGAARDGWSYVKVAVEREFGAVTDNPLVFAPSAVGAGPGGAEPIVSAGNFHGMPLAIPLDTLSVVVAHVAGISERRTFWMLSAFDAESHLRPYLSPTPGVGSGLMIAQYTAAACCNEIIGLCTPASVANVSTSAGMEDYNSFGPRAAMKARRAMDLAERVIAIELLCAAEGIEYHRPLRSGDGVEAVHAAVRSRVSKLIADRPPSPDIESITDLIRSGEISRIVRGA